MNRNEPGISRITEPLWRAAWDLARQRRTWSPFLLSGVLWRFFIHASACSQVHSLLTLPPFRKYARKNPRFPFKYLTHGYLANYMPVQQRLECFIHHHKRIWSALPIGLVLRMLDCNIDLYQISDGENRISVTMGIPRPPLDKEGELSLHLEMNGTRLYSLSFNVIPGAVVKSEAVECILITHLQGSGGRLPEIKSALKILHEYSPKRTLIAALEGVADGLGVRELAAVSAANQSSNSAALIEHLRRTYDDFFAELGMCKITEGYFLRSLPIASRSVELMKDEQRAKAKRRRAIRSAIQSACSSVFLKRLNQAADSPESVRPTLTSDSNDVHTSFEMPSGGLRPRQAMPSARIAVEGDDRFR